MAGEARKANTLVMQGAVSQVAELRYTPAGIPLLSFTLQHQSEQTEAGMQRRVECEVPVVALGEIASRAQQLSVGSVIRVQGFLAKRSMKSTQLVLHINTLEFE